VSEYTWSYPGDVVDVPAATPVAAGAVDHVQEALDRLPTQYTSDVGVTTLLAALAQPAQALEDTLRDMLLKRAVDTAEGAQLDIIGKLVGQARGGQDDGVYRRYIRARIKTSRSRGVTEDLITIAKLVVDDLDATIVIEQQQIASVIVRVTEVGVDEDTATAAIAFLRLAVVAGVRVILESSPEAAADTFTLDDGPGFDNGCARINLADYTANVDITVRARDGGTAGNSQTITLVGDSGGGVIVTGNATTDIVVHFDPGVSTVGDIESAIQNGSGWAYFVLDEDGASASPGTVTDAGAGDEMATTALADGFDGPYGAFTDARE
jgi:hypothetical protein